MGYYIGRRSEEEEIRKRASERSERCEGRAFGFSFFFAIYPLKNLRVHLLLRRIIRGLDQSCLLV